MTTPQPTWKTLPKTTLVDEVEQNLLDYFGNHNYTIGTTLPTEYELAGELGVARTVVREALSRLKMMHMVESRPKRGMVVTEPSLMGGLQRFCNPLWLNEKTLRDLLELRVILEIGATFSIFRNLNEGHIEELKSIVAVGEALGNNKYAPVSEYNFHTKLYEITGNATVEQFHEIIHPVLNFIKSKDKDFFEPVTLEMKQRGETVSHEELLDLLIKHDEEGYSKAIRQHFKPYTEYLKTH